MLAGMVQITISVSDEVYEWLAQKAESERLSVEAIITEQVNRIPASDPENPEFLRALRHTMKNHKELLRRLGE